MAGYTPGPGELALSRSFLYATVTFRYAVCRVILTYVTKYSLEIPKLHMA